MANKRYDQFTFGTPVMDNLILFADPTTGVLRKTDFYELPPPPKTPMVAVITLTQMGTAAPDVVELTNYFPVTFSAVRLGVGLYRLDASGTFFASAMIIIFQPNRYAVGQISVDPSSDTQADIITKNGSFANADGILDNKVFSFILYP